MTLWNDLLSIESFVKLEYPAATTLVQTEPSAPVDNMFVIRFTGGSRQADTGFHVRVDREYEIIHYGSDVEQVLEHMDGLSKALQQSQTIPMLNSGRHIRVLAFPFAGPAAAANDLYVCKGTLSTAVRENREPPAFEKIAQVYTRFSR